MKLDEARAGVTGHGGMMWWVGEHEMQEDEQQDDWQQRPAASGQLEWRPTAHIHIVYYFKDCLKD